MPPKESDKNKPAQRRKTVTLMPDSLSVLDASALPLEFRRFRQDVLFFLSHCSYFIKGKPEPRVLALTPTALFVTDAQGRLDRATRYDLIRRCTIQRQQRKRFLLGPEKIFQVVISAQNEPDTHFLLDSSSENVGREKEKDAWGVGDRFVDFLKKLMEACEKETGVKEFEVKEVDASVDVQANIKEEVEGFISPQQVIQLNRERHLLHERVDQTIAELNSIQEEVADLRPKVTEMEVTLEELGGTDANNLAQLREERAQWKENTQKSEKRLAELQMDMKSMEADTARLEEQLKEEVANYERLVKAKVNSADIDAEKSQKEIMVLRQKAQKRELDKINVRVAELTGKLATRPTYTGHAEYATKAQQLEEAIDKAVTQWMSDAELVNKTAKFLDHLTGLVEQNAREVAQEFKTKMELLNDIEKPPEEEKKEEVKPVAAAAAAAAAAPAKAAKKSTKSAAKPAAKGAKKAPAASADDDLL